MPNPRLLRPGPTASATADVDSLVDAVASAAPPQKRRSLGSQSEEAAVADWMLYQKAERMGALPEIISRPILQTDSRVDVQSGDHIWLVAGGGTPRQYTLSLVLTVEEIERSSSKPRFRFIGSVEWLDPAPRLNGYPWFELFVESPMRLRGMQKLEAEQLDGFRSLTD